MQYFTDVGISGIVFGSRLKTVGGTGSPYRNAATAVAVPAEVHLFLVWGRSLGSEQARPVQTVGL